MHCSIQLSFLQVVAVSMYAKSYTRKIHSFFFPLCLIGVGTHGINVKAVLLLESGSSPFLVSRRADGCLVKMLVS